jgi:uncharacterized protein YdaU (DUF1376 family)
MHSDSRDKDQALKVVTLSAVQQPQRPPPYFAFYVGDVQKRTMDMNGTEFGAYMLLVMYYWELDRLPAEADMHQVARLVPKVWRAISAKVVERVQHEMPFLDAEKVRIRDQSDRAKKGAEARWAARRQPA